MKKTKLIGLTSRLLVSEGVEKQFVNTRYLIPLQERGFNTLLLTLNNIDDEAILDLCDGFLITGGTDIDPHYYQEDNHGISKGIDRRLDDLDKSVVKHAIKHKKPLLGICRGLQSLNVFMGGSLIQDLGDKNKTHNSVKSDHLVTMVNDEVLNVNSYHHQAIKRLADELIVVAKHTDGTIEMVEHKHLPIFAVQWHPEINHQSKASIFVFDKFKALFK